MRISLNNFNYLMRWAKINGYQEQEITEVEEANYIVARLLPPEGDGVAVFYRRKRLSDGITVSGLAEKVWERYNLVNAK